MFADLSPCKGKSFKKSCNLQSFCPYRAPSWLPLYPGRCPGLRASAPSGRIGYFQQHGLKIFLLLMLLRPLIRKYFYFLCFWGCCRLARVTFCAFGAVAGLQGSLFVLLELLQACKGHFYKLLRQLNATFWCKSDKKTTIRIKFYR